MADASGRPYREFSALREALSAEGKQLAFAVNAGMYKEDFSPVGLFVAEGRELVPLNHHVGSGNFSQQPNGVFLIEGRSARVIDNKRLWTGETEANARDAIRTRCWFTKERSRHRPLWSPTSTWRKMRNGVWCPPLSTVVFVISEAAVTFYDFASFFRDSVHCREALYLDGTISSLYAPKLNREDRGSDMGTMLAVVESSANGSR